MRALPTILLVLSLPAGLLGYLLGTAVISALPLPQEARGILIVFGPLFIAGLCMLPFLVPWFDRRAKADLEAHRRSQQAAEKDGDEPDS
jgi:hypothetical protein